MIPDAFENDLRRQPLRAVPPAWRAAILDAADADRTSPATGRATAGWRGWLWPSPAAWGALAAAWLVIAALQLASRPAAAGAASPAPAPSARAGQALVEYQRVRAALLGGTS